jgi:hypothetical protein
MEGLAVTELFWAKERLGGIANALVMIYGVR